MKKVFIGVAVAVVLVAVLLSCTGVRHGIVSMMSPDYESAPKGEQITAEFTEEDAKRPRLEIVLTQVADEFIQITEMMFVPGDPELMIVFEKAGTAYWFDFANGSRGKFFQVKVLDDSEQGLLGIAFHPKFAENGKFYVATTVEVEGEHTDQVAEWSVEPGANLRSATPKETRVLLRIKDPYQNHNGGQLVFGPDGYLYTSMGDGGWAGDPHNHGQDTSTLLGDMLRIDVDKKDPGKEYAVPPDNPFVGKAGYQPEIWATGLRNPWRFSFDPRGRLIAADVGQDLYEEIDIVERGANLGWNIREAAHCFEKETCETAGLVDPIFEYGREEGGSVTGGYVATGDHVEAIAGKYVFGDFLSGRLWALELPDKIEPAKAFTLGKWPILPSVFARDEKGRMYVADFPDGFIFRIDPAKK